MLVPVPIIIILIVLVVVVFLGTWLGGFLYGMKQSEPVEKAMAELIKTQDRMLELKDEILENLRRYVDVCKEQNEKYKEVFDEILAIKKNRKKDNK